MRGFVRFVAPASTFRGWNGGMTRSVPAALPSRPGAEKDNRTVYLEPIPGPEKLAKIQLLPAVPVKATPVTMQELCDPSARAGSVLLETLRLGVLHFSPGTKPLKRSRYSLDLRYSVRSLCPPGPNVHHTLCVRHFLDTT